MSQFERFLKDKLCHLTWEEIRAVNRKSWGVIRTRLDGSTNGCAKTPWSGYPHLLVPRLTATNTCVNRPRLVCSQSIKSWRFLWYSLVDRVPRKPADKKFLRGLGGQLWCFQDNFGLDAPLGLGLCSASTADQL